DLHRLSGAELETDVVGGLYVADGALEDALPDREPYPHVLGFQHGLGAAELARGLLRRLGGQELARVRLARRLEKPRARPVLDDASVLHHVELVADLLD